MTVLRFILKHKSWNMWLECNAGQYFKDVILHKHAFSEKF